MSYLEHQCSKIGLFAIFDTTEVFGFCVKDVDEYNWGNVFLLI